MPIFLSRASCHLQSFLLCCLCGWEVRLEVDAGLRWIACRSSWSWMAGQQCWLQGTGLMLQVGPQIWRVGPPNCTHLKMSSITMHTMESQPESSQNFSHSRCQTYNMIISKKLAMCSELEVPVLIGMDPRNLVSWMLEIWPMA
jgi:hypothetical protein